MTGQTLLLRLKTAIEGMGLDRTQLGHPEMVLKEVHRAEALFKDFSKAKPNEQDAYRAALLLLRGGQLDDWSTHLVAAAVSIPIKEFGGRTVLESDHCEALFRQYESEARRGDLWRLTWYSLFNSYLTFELGRATTDAGKAGFENLRRLLHVTWPTIDRQSGQVAVPDWVRILREESQLLSDKPVEKYARDYLMGHTDHIRSMAVNLGIPANSWFWQELVLGAVRHAAEGSDERFRGQLSPLIELVKAARFYRDIAIAEMLNRYHRCASKEVHAELRDYVIHPSVWRNPKLKAAGIATAWNQVPEPVWRMVMGWVNERNLRDFFDILAARRHADHGRLKFWSRYMNQISWTRLVFGSETIWQKNHNAGIRALLESEEGTYAKLQGATDKELDAFLMQIGDYIFVEFSKTGNGAYAYRASDLPFSLNASTYTGSTSDLKMGYYRQGRAVAKIIHQPGWEERTAYELGKLGIHPDRPAARQEPLGGRPTGDLASLSGNAGDLAHGAGLTSTAFRPPAPTPTADKPSSLTLEKVRRLVGPYGATVVERGSGLTKRLWVTDPQGSQELARQLKGLGFKWSNSREGWYWMGE